MMTIMRIKKNHGNKKYGIKPRYEVYVNKLLLGIFKTKREAERYKTKWKRQHKEWFK